jgi:opacity protein-like surface antigen
MKKITLIAALTIAALLPLSLRAQTTPTEKAAAPSSSFKFQIGLTYLGGFSDITDVYENNGYDLSFKNPVGINFMVRQEFSNGLGWDVNLGPSILIVIDSTYGSYSESSTDFILPIEADVRYTFFPNKDITPYVRGGLRYMFVSSDTWENDGLGFGVGVGVEFSHTKSFSYGIELSASTAQLKYETYNMEDTAKPCKFCVSVYCAF